ncbi:PilX N-terminal domain-containing pilus assembly protein [Geoalkalibacter halelectricus]|uniref:PilX N-terminal domain-containing pilus assembly protein n=1 Tax=Geoalkalibacter halelectricus TaxID=2847045 RepID=A0ABY5ZI99_9BACT|nr:PilX N-terminal domain-containing pilus assembly protein [Geoalkalibacter halelectricus]MDO3377783.1 PilX N-terminal domain-containing pilus assembly protein [Geoalkalibacter halelectricus]UWZ78624.1 PilX N-terminal domain-containing pilus assembly protein [Geoalkalibacter halelectricus]
MMMPKHLNDQCGAALLTALMVLALLTLLGMAATSAALTEIRITRNEVLRDSAFYQAEGGWQYALSWLADQPDELREDLGSRAAPSSWAQAFCAQAATAPETLDRDGLEQFAVSIHYLGTSHAPLYSTDFQRIDFSVHSRGFGPLQAQALIEVQVGRLLDLRGY